MGWRARTIEGEQVICGAIGDPLTLHVVATFDRYIDFTGHTWLCQVRRNVPAGITATLELIDDSTTATPPADENDPGSATIDLLFRLVNTSVFTDSERELYGVKAIEGDNAPYTLIPAAPIIGYDVVPRQETT